MKKQKPAASARSPQKLVAGGSPFWLLKSEPDVFSWDMLVERGKAGEPWTGVRNYLARNHMRAMKVGDLGFFYHSNIGKEIVGILQVIKPAYPEPGDATGTWDCVDVIAVCAFPKPVTLAAVKADGALIKMALVTSMRLSVQPVTTAEWQHVCGLGHVDLKQVAKTLTAKAAEKLKA